MEHMFDSPLRFLDWLTMGAADAVSGAIMLHRRFYRIDQSGFKQMAGIAVYFVRDKKDRDSYKKDSDDQNPFLCKSL